MEPIGDRVPSGDLLAFVETATTENVTSMNLPNVPGRISLIGPADRQYHFVNPYDGEIIRSPAAPAIVMQAVRIFHVSFLPASLVRGSPSSPPASLS